MADRRPAAPLVRGSRTPAPSPAPPSEPARVSLEAAPPPRVVVLPRCSCGESGLLHTGARGDGACLLPNCECTAYQEANRADPE